MDIAKGEATERQFGALIARRHDRRVAEEGERQAEEAWMESETRFDARRREERRREWAEYHRGQAECCRAVLASLVRGATKPRSKSIYQKKGRRRE